MTLKLPDEIERFIEDRVKSGEYSSAQDVVCAGLRLLKKHDEARSQNEFAPGEWDGLLAEAETGDEMSLEELIARRQAERSRGGAHR